MPGILSYRKSILQTTLILLLGLYFSSPARATLAACSGSYTLGNSGAGALISAGFPSQAPPSTRLSGEPPRPRSPRISPVPDGTRKPPDRQPVLLSATRRLSIQPTRLRVDPSMRSRRSGSRPITPTNPPTTPPTISRLSNTSAAAGPVPARGERREWTAV